MDADFIKSSPGRTQNRMKDQCDIMVVSHEYYSTWNHQQCPGGPNVGPMNFVIWSVGPTAYIKSMSYFELNLLIWGRLWLYDRNTAWLHDIVSHRFPGRLEAMVPTAGCHWLLPTLLAADHPAGCWPPCCPLATLWISGWPYLITTQDPSCAMQYYKQSKWE